MGTREVGVTMIESESLESAINAVWTCHEKGNEIPLTGRHAIEAAISELDRGQSRIATKLDGKWSVCEWLKKAIILYFAVQKSELILGKGSVAPAFDKIPLKFKDWTEKNFLEAKIRVLPGAIVRRSAYIAKGCVLMPCFINAGAYIGENSMIDTWATVGSCAQIGSNVHISGGAGIGGVLEPAQASPVIIEDGCFIGARSEVAEGVIVEEGAVLSMGDHLAASTPIIDRESGEIYRGRVPARSVLVPGTMPHKPLSDGKPGPGLSCAVIVKKVDQKTRDKTALNKLLREI